MSLNGVGVVLTTHAFSWPVIDVTMYVARPEIAITEAIITTDNRTDFWVFTEINSNGVRREPRQ
jgi:hypothetical protein